MRQGSLSVLFALCLLAPTLQAQEPEGPPVAEREAVVEQQLGNQQAEEPLSEASAVEKAQLMLLREENQRLKTLLQQQQTKPAPASPLLNDQQQWFAVGGGVGVLGFLLGVLATRGRRRRQWLN